MLPRSGQAVFVPATFNTSPLTVCVDLCTCMISNMMMMMYARGFGVLGFWGFGGDENEIPYLVKMLLLWAKAKYI